MHTAVTEIQVTRLGWPVPAEAAFDALYRDAPYAFWLDSASTGASGGRFSFLGAASKVVRAWPDRIEVARIEPGRAPERVEVTRPGFFAWLADALRVRVDVPDVPFGFTVGWVGYLGYELKAECGGVRAFASADPDAVMMYVDRTIVVDHAAGETYLVSADQDWTTETAALLAALPDPEPVRPVRAAAVRARHSRDSYIGMIERCQDAIRRGESYEVCLTNMLTARADIDPWQAYRLLRRHSPAPYGAYLRLGDMAVLSSSPERFLRIQPDGAVESRPIKGTRPRGGTPAEDLALRLDLATNDKDRAENLMIVDLVRNDLGRCAAVGSVHVPAIFEVETYATVHQLVSTVRARLGDGVSPVHCVQSAFPGGSMTGAPKIRTMEIIDSLEQGPRGVYSGALGYFSLSGHVDLSIVIRTLVLRPGEASFGVGGAIIDPSEPGAEFDETVVKATAMLRVLGAEFPTT
nr:aminodeoxychorismate synthase component I [Kibdelosporangium sp. MJ126-NF4]CEL22649.1 Para-aminobenzoate synthase, amidotransferase component / Para-aminobenzoate synthase, aminase component [Kibdelosporangium sp. MJ126-NF4]CTQ89790.1 Para-aminobenzoate synthase, amidotransferase component (EC 2.6.1.85) / Para-aminobenzoate synthase, aminase component (EC 2.6.1.85) [Kibdelosporangium sp. MJ126-NF4]